MRLTWTARTLTLRAPFRIARGVTSAREAPADAADHARRLAATGFSTIKAKLDAEAGADVVAAVRAAAPDATLLVDPNGAWGAEQAARHLDALAPHRVAAVEQPVPAGDLDGHLLLADDPWRGIGGENGRLTLPAGPGLGIRCR